MESNDETMITDPFELVGTTLAEKYRIDTILGEGGFGLVYGGTHLVIGVPIAIKRMKPFSGACSARVRATESFLREAKMLFTLTHPAIVRLYDVGTVTAESGTVPYVVLEYLDGGSLELEIATRATSYPPRHFSASEVLRIFKPILEGVDYLHANGVAHRDLKPSNLMLTQGSTLGGNVHAKVVDFGIARWIGDGGVRTVGAKNMAFTPRYAAPEQWDPSLGLTGAPTDVFALGLILAEAFMLRPVLSSPGTAQIFIEVMQPRNLELAAVRPDLPPELTTVLERACEVDPRKRYSTAGELLSALIDVIGLDGHDAKPSSRRLSPIRAAKTFAPTVDATGAAVELQRATTETLDSGEAPVFVAEAQTPVANGSEPAPEAAPSIPRLSSGVVRAHTPFPGRSAPSPDEAPAARSAPQSRGPRILASDADHLTAFWGPVFLTVWKKVSRVSDARAIQFAVRDLAMAVPGRKVACLTVIEERAELPDGDTRAAVANILRFNSENLVCSANIMEGEGFRAAAVRGVVTGIALVARQPFPNHVFASVPASATWICDALAKAGAPAISPADLVAAVEQVRSVVAAPAVRPLGRSAVGRAS